ncbi:hypothetical protein FDN13_04710 [Caloramator sp. E03]|nr:hypothetical protein FDN13_04710 [Caloramator sp. E03]
MNCKCNFGNPWTLIILILIVLKFSSGKDHGWGGGMIDNSILFIIALFLLVYCGCGKGLMKYDC